MDNLWSRLLANVIKLLSGSLLISEVSLLGLSETQVKVFSGTEGKRNKQMGKTGVKDQLMGKHGAMLLQV